LTKIARYLLIGRSPDDDSNVLMKGFVKQKNALEEYENCNWTDKSIWKLIKKEENKND